MSTEPAGPAAPETPDAASVLQNAPTTSSRRLALLAFALAVVVVAVDQLTKWWALSTLEAGAPQRNLLGEFLSLRLVFNPGAALGKFAGYTWALTIVVVAVVVVIIRVISKIRSRAWAITLGLLLGGAIGNLIDRLFRAPGFAHGHVVDFIGYWNWFTGNVADIAIVVAAVMLALLSLRGIGLDGLRDSERGTATPTQGESPEVRGRHAAASGSTPLSGPAETTSSEADS